MAAPLYLIDASIYIFRAWFSMPQTVIGADNQPANALYGYLDFLTRFIDEARPRHIVAVFDGRGKSFRKDIYPKYKSNRDPAPPELKRQIAFCRLLTRALGVSETSHDNYEADDLIGTLAARSAAQSRPVVIVSGDKDLAQLVGENDAWWDYSRGGRLDSEGVKNQFGVYPGQIVDLLAIAGDPSDSIPGARGIGTVTAVRLLEHFGSLERLLSNPEDIAQVKIRGAKRVASLIREYADEIALSRRLAQIECAAPLDSDFPTAPRAPDTGAFEALSEQVGFSAYRRKQYQRSVDRLAGAISG